ncbi:cation diffusion facilitator family transporter [Phenylobacterium sp.]|uniref:cation diffusion facilitator family transporter n=1 Tax=Phenylobacterium sp. TaxID=1871053 RepID=UPI002F4207AD
MTATDPPTPQAAPLDEFRGDRVYLGADHARNERRTWIVAGVCAATLVAQVAGGLAFHSMALTASGLHMGAHVAALGVAAAAYALARRHAQDARFSFGTGKLGYLAGFANAVVLAVTAIAIGVESVQRVISPEAVDYAQAVPLAVAGLAVNLVCVWLLQPSRAVHEHGADLNLSAAHLHLSADAATSVLAIGGLLAGQRFGWTWTDPAAGLVGAVLVARFAWSLLSRAGPALLDMNPSPELTAEIRARLGAEGERVVDLHLWRLGPGHHAAVAVVASGAPLPPDAYRARLNGLAGLSHVTVEVRREA